MPDACEFSQLFQDIAAKEDLFSDRPNEDNRDSQEDDSYWRDRPERRCRRGLAHDGSRQCGDEYPSRRTGGRPFPRTMPIATANWATTGYQNPQPWEPLSPAGKASRRSRRSKGSRRREANLRDRSRRQRLLRVPLRRAQRSRCQGRNLDGRRSVGRRQPRSRSRRQSPSFRARLRSFAAALQAPCPPRSVRPSTCAVRPYSFLSNAASKATRLGSKSSLLDELAGLLGAVRRGPCRCLPIRPTAGRCSRCRSRRG